MNTNAVSLDRLHDIIVPAPVPWWPPAPGWYWVLGFVLVMALVLALRAFIHWQRNRYRREALAELAQLEHQWKASGERAPVLLGLSELLKRTALTAFSREQIAALTGAKWFAFLDRTGPRATFGDGLGAALENAIYDPRVADAFGMVNFQELVSAVRNWIKNHHTGVGQKEATATKDRRSDEPSLPSLPSFHKPC